MEAEQARTRSEAEHRKTAANYNSCISHMRQLEKKLKRSINKSRSQPLFYSPPRPFVGLEVCVCVSLCVFVCEWETVSTFVSSDAVQMFHVLGCVVQGWAPAVRAQECECSQRSVILPAVFSSDSRHCVSSLTLCLCSLSPPVGRILN